MERRERWLRWALILCVVAGLLVACVPPTGSAPGRLRAGTAAPTRTPAEPGTLVWSTWGSEWSVAINRRVARLFEAEHPGVRIEIVHRDWDVYFDWLKDEWVAGRSPDVMFLNYIPMRAPDGTLENLDPYLARDGFDLSDFYPALLQQFTYQGSYYGFPRDNDTKVLYYNRNAFDEAGLAYPNDTWTWDELRQAAIRLTRDNPHRYGFGFEASHWWRLWLWQNGADIVDDPLAPSRITLNTPEAIAALDYLAGLANRDRVTPPLDKLTTDGMFALFAQGRLAMMVGNHGLIPKLVEGREVRWDVARLPQGQRRANMAGGAGYTISRLSQNKELAWSFVKFLSGLKAQAVFAESGLITPARRSVREDNIFLRQQPYNAAVFLQETETGRPNLMFPRADEMNALLDQRLEPVWRGERRAADAVAEVVPELERLLPPR